MLTKIAIAKKVAFLVNLRNTKK